MAQGRPTAIARAALAWYDKSARDLPWRLGPAEVKAGARPEPYRVWLSEIMLQQTTVAAVRPYFERFTQAWPSVEALAAAPLEDVTAAWAGLGYYSRARNLHACAQVVAGERGGRFPDDEAALRALPGIGPYTAAAIAAIAFDKPAVVVDGNIERVTARLHAVTDPSPGSKGVLKQLAAEDAPARRPGDYAQAMMDLGALVCTPKAPSCLLCPLQRHCKGFAAGIAAELPRKAPKPEKPLRKGVAFALFRQDGAVLLRRRPPKGLLGGMLALPSTPWEEGAVSDPAAHAPLETEWRPAAAPVRHTFTHFHLELEVWRGEANGVYAVDGEWAGPDAAAALPTVMRKALRAALTI